MDWANQAANAIWEDLCDRRGFGLECLDVDDPEAWADIQAQHARIIHEAAEAAEVE